MQFRLEERTSSLARPWVKPFWKLIQILGKRAFNPLAIRAEQIEQSSPGLIRDIRVNHPLIYRMVISMAPTHVNRREDHQ
jgi:hypothetical protein